MNQPTGPVKWFNTAKGFGLGGADQNANAGMPLHNALLDSLPGVVRDHLIADCVHLAMPQGHILCHSGQGPRHAHFLTSGLANFIAATRDGSGIETGVTGYEGLVEAMHTLGRSTALPQSQTQAASAAYRMDFSRFMQVFHTVPEVRRATLRSAQLQATMANQIVLCNTLHPLEQRLARWLLMIADRMPGQQIPVTHEHISRSLGAMRSSVSVNAARLQAKGLVRYTRGKLTILDRVGLEDHACECYGLARRTFDEYLHHPPLVSTDSDNSPIAHDAPPASHPVSQRLA